MDIMSVTSAGRSSLLTTLGTDLPSMKITPPSSKANLITASRPEFSPTRSRMPSVNSTTPKSFISSDICLFPFERAPREWQCRPNKNGRSVNPNRPFVWRKLFLLLLLGRWFIEPPLDQSGRVVDDDEAH